MRCHSCGTDVREGQKFCMECGASLRGVADITGEVPVIRAGTPPPGTDEATAEQPVTPPPPARPAFVPPAPHERASGGDRTEPIARTGPVPTPADDRTVPLSRTPPSARVDPVAATAPSAGSAVPASGGVAARARSTEPVRVVEATEPPAQRTAELPVAAPPAPTAALPAVWEERRPAVWEERPATPSPPPERRRFRLRPLLLLALLAAGATAVAVLATVVRIAPPPDGAAPEYTVNDFGTNNTVAAAIAAGSMVVGALVWCRGHRWGAGLAGGAGASLAGWAALVAGAAEWRLDLAAPDAELSRSLGYGGLVAAGVLGLLVMVGSFASSGRDGRAGLDPWIAALAAVSFVIAAGGPLVPQGTADWAANWTGETDVAGLPTAFFAGRAAQLGLVLLCGVVGCLLVRRWGLGLAVGGSLAAGWQLVTAATDRTPSPVGPGYANPPFDDLQPHGVTVVGFALAGFFALVAVVMALLDVDR